MAVAGALLEAGGVATEHAPSFVRNPCRRAGEERMRVVRERNCHERDWNLEWVVPDVESLDSRYAHGGR